jgi:heterotetrameric sarcosine oxidase gamma subunit
MTLSTVSNLPFLSPIGAESPAGVMGRLWLEDFSGSWVLLRVQGQAEEALRRAFGDVPAAPGDVLEVGWGAFAACLRPDLYLLLLQPEDGPRLAESLQADAGPRLTVTDITHGRAVLHLNGSLSGAMLPKLCGLDFHPDAFPNFHAAPTSYAKVRAVIIRLDAEEESPAWDYYLIVDRSQAGYVWAATADAMDEFLPLPPPRVEKP